MNVWARIGIAFGSLLVGVSYFAWPPANNPAIELAARAMVGIPLGLAVVFAWRYASHAIAERNHLASFAERVRSASPAEWDVLCRVARDGDERVTLQSDDPVVQELVEASLLVRIGGQSLYGDSATYALSDEARGAVLGRCRSSDAAT